MYFCSSKMMVSKKKGKHSPSGRKMRQFKKSKDCIAALSVMASIVFGSLLQQVWPFLF